ncbi:hypothetical protein DFH09DRAFT_1284448 [Mycena vulgaris]|nr:hypothetical protein DFH09DRAFT_1284448 [Mycena vulgaris]
MRNVLGPLICGRGLLCQWNELLENNLNQTETDELGAGKSRENQRRKEEGSGTNPDHRGDQTPLCAFDVPLPLRRIPFAFFAVCGGPRTIRRSLHGRRVPPYRPSLVRGSILRSFWDDDEQRHLIPALLPLRTHVPAFALHPPALSTGTRDIPAAAVLHDGVARTLSLGGDQRLREEGVDGRETGTKGDWKEQSGEGDARSRRGAADGGRGCGGGRDDGEETGTNED